MLRRTICPCLKKMLMMKVNDDDDDVTKGTGGIIRALEMLPCGFFMTTTVCFTRHK